MTATPKKIGFMGGAASSALARAATPGSAAATRESTITIERKDGAPDELVIRALGTTVGVPLGGTMRQDLVRLLLQGQVLTIPMPRDLADQVRQARKHEEHTA